MLILHMIIHLSLRHKPPITNLTSKRFLSQMALHVGLQGPPLGEAPAANGAAMGSLARMGQNVLLHGGF